MKKNSILITATLAIMVLFNACRKDMTEINATNPNQFSGSEGRLMITGLLVFRPHWISADLHWSTLLSARAILTPSLWSITSDLSCWNPNLLTRKKRCLRLLQWNFLSKKISEQTLELH